MICWVNVSVSDRLVVENLPSGEDTKLHWA